MLNITWVFANWNCTLESNDKNLIGHKNIKGHNWTYLSRRGSKNNQIHFDYCLKNTF